MMFEDEKGQDGTMVHEYGSHCFGLVAGMCSFLLPGDKVAKNQSRVRRVGFMKSCLDENHAAGRPTRGEVVLRGLFPNYDPGQHETWLGRNSTRSNSKN